MPEDSMSVYVRSLVIDAIEMGATNIDITKDGDKIRISLSVPGETVRFPHPPKANYGDLFAHIRAKSGVDDGNGTLHVTRRGNDVPVPIAIAKNSIRLDIPAGLALGVH